MLKGELAIVVVGLLTTGFLYTRLGAQDERVPASKVESADGERDADPCQKGTCITFLGTLRVGDNFIELGSKRLRKWDRRLFFKGMEPLLKNSSTTIANLETPLIKPPLKSKRATNRFFWADKAKLTPALKTARITAVSLANSHIMDFGDVGIRQTLETLEAARIVPFGYRDPSDTSTEESDTENEQLSKSTDSNLQDAGVAEPAEIPGAYTQKLEVNGDSVELIVLGAAGINSQEGMGPLPIRLDVDAMSEQIRSLRSVDDRFIIAYLKNAAIRGTALPMQQQAARALIDAGADFVVGCGSRFVQVPEQYQGKWIVYSLGEAVTTTTGAISDAHKLWPYSGVLRLIWDKTGTPSYRIYPILNHVQQTDFNPRLLNRPEFGGFYWYLLRKGRIEYDRLLKQKMFPGEDETGHYITLGGVN